MHAYILLGKVRTLLEWADEPMGKMYCVWVSGVEFMTTRALYGAKKRVTNPYHLLTAPTIYTH